MEWWQKLLAVWLLGNVGVFALMVVAAYVPAGRYSPTTE